MTPQEEAGELLVQAWLEGHPQVRSITHRRDAEGDCAVGILHLAMHGGRRDEAIACRRFPPIEIQERFHVDIEAIIYMNDTKRFDFLTIGRKLLHKEET